MTQKRPEKMTAPRMLEAVKKEVGKRARVIQIPDTLEALQSAVGGNIEVVSYDPNNIIVCNEDGLMLGLAENCLGIVGNFLVLGRGSGAGEMGDVIGPKAVCAGLREAAPDDL